MKYSTRAEYWVDPKSGIPRYEFNELYQDYSDPWGCGKDFNSIVNRLFLEILFPPGKIYKSFLDIGCGTGELTNWISCRNNYCEVESAGNQEVGFDISSIAIDRAKKKFPDIEFLCVDILKDDFASMEKFQLIVCAEVIWYFANKIQDVLKKISSIMEVDSILAIHQYFPNEQRYFKSQISGVSGFLNIMKESNFQLDEKVIYHTDDGIVLLAKFGH